MKLSKEHKTTSFLSQAVQLNGNLVVKGGIRIDGTIIGTIKSESTIFFGDTAVMDGEISTKSLVSSGRIKGTVSAKDTVKINQPGSIEGQITTSVLSVDRDVFFNAKCTLTNPQNNHPPKLKTPKLPRKAIPNHD
jgi:cytoskeletal protein CcmA (bactofilin family)